MENNGESQRDVVEFYFALVFVAFIVFVVFVMSIKLAYENGWSDRCKRCWKCKGTGSWVKHRGKVNIIYQCNKCLRD